jgi:hypothetical protein
MPSDRPLTHEDQEVEQRLPLVLVEVGLVVEQRDLAVVLGLPFLALVEGPRHGADVDPVLAVDVLGLQRDPALSRPTA